MRSLLIYAAVVVALVAGQAARAEESPWSASGGMGGTYSSNTGSSAETVYWGPFARVGYEISDPLRARVGMKHARDRFIYDGLGGIAKQSQTGITPGLNWEITDAFSVDVEYSFRLGENQYREHQGVVAFEYAIFDWLRAGLDGFYGQQNYLFPVSEQKVLIRSYGFTGELAFQVSRQVEIPLAVNWLSSRYSTNKSVYVARNVGTGITFRTADRRWLFSGQGLIGNDSSNYLMIGLEARVRYNISEHISARLSGTYSGYSYSSDQQAKSRRNTTGETVSPLGNTDRFSVASVGLEFTCSY